MIRYRKINATIIQNASILYSCLDPSRVSMTHMSSPFHYKKKEEKNCRIFINHHVWVAIASAFASCMLICMVRAFSPAHI